MKISRKFGLELQDGYHLVHNYGRIDCSTKCFKLVNKQTKVKFKNFILTKLFMDCKFVIFQPLQRLKTCLGVKNNSYNVDPKHTHTQVFEPST